MHSVVLIDGRRFGRNELLACDDQLVLGNALVECRDERVRFQINAHVLRPADNDVTV